MKALLLVNGFPSDSDPVRGIFNYNAARNLNNKIDLRVVQIRTWKPGLPLIKQEKYLEVNVLRLSLFKIPFSNYWINKFNLFLGRRIVWILLKNHLKDIDILHSVFVTQCGIYGAFCRKKIGNRTKHVSQAIGSDINSQMVDILAKGKTPKWTKYIDGILCNSKDLKRNVEIQFPDLTHVKVAYRGISPVKFGLKTPKRQTEEFNILYLGGFSNYPALKFGQNTKGGITLMQAWSAFELNEESQNVNLIVGGPNSNSEFVSNWIANLKFPYRVQNVGYISSDKIQDIILNSKLLVIPSMEEGLPNLLLEGGLLSTPIIASNVGGIPEVIQHEQNGLLFEAGNSNVLNNMLLKATKNKNLKYLGEKLHQTIIENFDSNNFGLSVISMYESVSK